MTAVPGVAPGAEVVWAPTPDSIESSRLWAFREWVRTRRGLAFDDYPSMWAWSVDQPSDFWDSVREFFDMIGEGFDGPALAENRMPGAVWYPHARVNYAENVLRHATERPTDIAIVEVADDGRPHEWTWADLAGRVCDIQAQLIRAGVGIGDRVGAVLPNEPGTVAAMLATVGLGAVWSLSSPDLSAAASVDRLRPLTPKVVLGSSGYTFKGRWIDTRALGDRISAELPGATLLLLDEVPARDGGTPRFVRIPFDHPLWVLFSSGTTGAPKGIVHGHGGIMLEAFKGIGLHYGMGPGKRYFTSANTSWMVWNTLGNTLLTGAAVVTYAGAPTWPTPDRLFEVTAVSKSTMLSTGAAYLGVVERAGLRPGDDHDLSALTEIMSTGSVLPPSTWRWVHEAVGAGIHLHSDSGGTDICSGFIGGNPWQPAIVGESQGPTLGHAIDVRREDGTPAVVDEVGEMVITGPTPSMPVRFWNDPDGSLYRAAYFAQHPGVWTQGDWIRRTVNGGMVIEGRSDATLNRDGVRLGSADVYAALQTMPQIRDAVVLGIELPGGGYWMPLFVQLQDDVELDDDLRTEIGSRIRARSSARHVPDAIEAVPGIPVTHAGKRIEVPLKKLFLGHAPDAAVNAGSLADPDSVKWFVDRAESFRTEHGIEKK